MEDHKFSVYQEIRDHIETKMQENKFSKEDIKETIRMLVDDLQ